MIRLKMVSDTYEVKNGRVTSISMGNNSKFKYILCVGEHEVEITSSMIRSMSIHAGMNKSTVDFELCAGEKFSNIPLEMGGCVGEGNVPIGNLRVDWATVY